MTTDIIPAIPADYTSSRQRFLEAAEALGAAVQSYPLEPYYQRAHPSEGEDGGARTTPSLAGPAGEPLYVDAAVVGPAENRLKVFASCGLHGVEGFFGAAVLHHWMASPAPQATKHSDQVTVVLLHAINPWGFAWGTRFNEDNVDPNRNFLLPDEPFEGSPAMYARLNRLLNPQRLPSRLEPVRWKLAVTVARHGMAALKQAVAGGQYEYPRGLFFGGRGPIASQRLLAGQLPQLAGEAERVLHIDYHTGLGRRGTYAMLSDQTYRDEDRQRLHDAFGRERLREPEDAEADYIIRGGLGRWCRRTLGDHYLAVGAEYGTYPPLEVLLGLREENLTRQHLPYDHPRRRRARARLQELFCPRSAKWRRWAIPSGASLIDRAVATLAQKA